MHLLQQQHVLGAVLGAPEGVAFLVGTHARQGHERVRKTLTLVRLRSALCLACPTPTVCCVHFPVLVGGSGNRTCTSLRLAVPMTERTYASLTVGVAGELPSPPLDATIGICSRCTSAVSKQRVPCSWLP